MGFAEIQAAFAAQQGQPAPVAVQAPASPQFTPSPFAPSPAAPVQAPAAPVQAPAAPVQAPVQQAFTFTPPAGAPTGPAPGQPWPPINPPGERAPLAVGATGAPAAVAQDVVQNFTQPADPAKLGPVPPKAKRGRKPKSEIVITGQGGVRVFAGDLTPVAGGTAAEARQVANFIQGADLAAEGAAVATLPADGSTVEDIVSELFARGVSSVHLTFTKDGK